MCLSLGTELKGQKKANTEHCVKEITVQPSWDKTCQQFFLVLGWGFFWRGKVVILFVWFYF